MKRTHPFLVIAICFLVLGAGCVTAEQQLAINATLTPDAKQANEVLQAPTTQTEEPLTPEAEPTPAIVNEAIERRPPDVPQNDVFLVTHVVDGDTFDVDIDGTTERLRLIGIDTPETVDPRKPVQCFGKEASDRAKTLLIGQSVRLEADASQDNRDKYGRLLRYAFLPDGMNYGLAMIRDGYAYEYTYDVAYKYQKEFKAAQAEAKAAGRGLWAKDTCAGQKGKSATETPSVTPSKAAIPPTSASEPQPTSCLIKGNISSDKIFHVPGCSSYDSTTIDESKGERWFCTEAEAVAAGWRRAKNCS